MDTSVHRLEGPITVDYLFECKRHLESDLTDIIRARVSDFVKMTGCRPAEICVDLVDSGAVLSADKSGVHVAGVRAVLEF